MKTVETMYQEIMMKKHEILVKFTEAYIAETGLKPSEVELVEVREDKQTRWYFRKREVLEKLK